MRWQLMTGIFEVLTRFVVISPQSHVVPGLPVHGEVSAPGALLACQ